MGQQYLVSDSAVVHVLEIYVHITVPPSVLSQVLLTASLHARPCAVVHNCAARALTLRMYSIPNRNMHQSQMNHFVTSMHELHQSVMANLATAGAPALAAQRRATALQRRLDRRSVVQHGILQQPLLAEKPSRDAQLALQIQASVSQQHQHNHNAARYASAAKRVTAKHQLALQAGTSDAKLQHSVVQKSGDTVRQLQLQQLDRRLDQVVPNVTGDQQQQHMLQVVGTDANKGVEQGYPQQQLQGMDVGMQQLLSRQLQQRGKAAAASLFSQLLHVCDMCARSSSMADWAQGAQCMQQLVQQVSSPLQAQQAWQVAVSLQSHPLHRDCCGVLAGAVVALLEVTLANHDHSTLQQLMAGRLLGFHFNRSHVVRLLRAVTRADVGLEELQALLDMLPAKLLTNRAYYVLINCFMARQQYTEAGHCFHQMEVAGLRLTPSLQALQLQLKAVRQRAAAV